jgi:uncharacterized membrane protein HdeD (DUF308 family)
MNDISARRDADHRLSRRDMDDISGRPVRVSGFEAELLARWRDDVARHWKLLLGMGLLCDVVGLWAILVPAVASISVAILVGWVLAVGGIVQLGHLFRAGSARREWWRVLVAALTILAGIWILIFPLSGTITLTVVLVAWLWMVGGLRLLAWWRMRDREENTWLTLVSGIVSIVLGVLIWADLPSSATWAIGLLVGIELVFTGSALIATAIAGRNLARESTSRPVTA